MFMEFQNIIPSTEFNKGTWFQRHEIWRNLFHIGCTEFNLYSSWILVCNVSTTSTTQKPEVTTTVGAIIEGDNGALAVTDSGGLLWFLPTSQDVCILQKNMICNGWILTFQGPRSWSLAVG